VNLTDKLHGGHGNSNGNLPSALGSVILYGFAFGINIGYLKNQTNFVAV